MELPLRNNLNTLLTRAAMICSLLISIICICYALLYIYWMIADGFIAGRNKKVAEDAMEFWYFSCRYFGPGALFGFVASWFSGSAKRFFISVALIYPVLLFIYLFAVKYWLLR